MAAAGIERESNTLCDTFHEAIEAGSIEKVEELIQDTPSLKVVYDRNNKSALTTALQSKEFEIHALLIANGFSSGCDELYEKTLRLLQKGEKDLIQNANKKYFKTLDISHVHYILSKTSIGSLCNKIECFKVIRKMYTKLNSISEVKAVMMALEQSDSLEIVFDFKNPHVQYVTPFGCRQTKGITFPREGYIVIAAQNHQEKFLEIIGVIAHEFTHYAMQLIYSNDTKPYRKNDRNNEQKFLQIVENLDFYKETNVVDSIIKNVFAYDESEWPDELIVCVPHLLAHYNGCHPNVSTDIRQTYGKVLFKFFDDVTMKDLKTQSALIKSKKDIREINEIDGLVSEVRNLKFFLRCDKLSSVELLDGTCFKIVLSNAPKLLLTSILRELKNEHSELNNLFVRKASLAKAPLLDKIRSLQASDLKPFVIVDCTEEQLSVSDLNFYQNDYQLTNYKKFVFILKIGNFCDDFKCFDCKITTFHHQIDDLNGKSRKVALEQKVQFQGKLVVVKELLSDISRFSKLSLDILLYGEVNINKKLQQPGKLSMRNHYVDRKFCVGIQKENLSLQSKYLVELGMVKNRNQQLMRQIATDLMKKTDDKVVSVEMNLKEFLDHSKTENVIIISDWAGNGKTTTLFQVARKLKEQNPSHWVEFVDLKTKIKAIKAQKELSGNFLEFLIRVILALEVEFDQQVFQSLYESGRVILLLDGFDEISPHYKDLILNQIKTFDQERGNKMFITSRPHLQRDLENSLKKTSCSLLPFTEDDQLDYLLKFQTENKTPIDRKAAETLIKKVLEVTTSTNDESFVGKPLLLSMIAEIFDGKEEEESFDSLTLFNVFKIFFKKFQKILSSEKGEIPKDDQDERNNLSNIRDPLTVHHHMALDHFGLKRPPSVKSKKKEFWNDERIARIGIVSSEKEFVHETFAEFFAADYFYDLLTDEGLTEEDSISLFTILTDMKFGTVRLFLDNALQKTEYFEEIQKNMFEEFQPFEDENENFNILTNIIQENHETLINLCLLPQNASIFNEIMKSAQTQKQNSQDVSHIKLKRVFAGFLRLSFETNRAEIIKTLLDAMEHIMPLQELKDVVLQRNEDGINILHKASKNRNEGTYKAVRELLLRMKISKEELKELVKEKIFLSVNTLNFHLIATNSHTDLKELSQILIETLNKDDLKTVLKQGRGFFVNSFAVAALKKSHKYIEVLWNFMQSSLDDNELLNTLTQADPEGSNALHLSIRYNNLNSINKVFEIVQSRIQGDELKAYLQKLNNANQNILHLAALNEMFEGTVSTVNEILSTCLSSEEIRSMMRLKDDQGFNPLQICVVCNNNKYELLETLRLASEVFGKDELKTILQYEENEQFISVFAYAAGQNSKECIEALWNFLRTLLDDNELQQVITQTSAYGTNVLHIAISGNKVDVINKVFEIVKSRVQGEDLKRYLQSLDNNNRSILHLASENKENEGIVSRAFKILSSHLSAEEIQSLMQSKDIQGRNFVQTCITFNNTKKCLQEVLTILTNKVLGDDAVKELLQDKSNDNKRNVLAFAAGHSSLECLETLWSFTQYKFKDDELYQLLTQTDGLGMNLFQTAVLDNSEDVIEKIIKIVQSKVVGDELKMFLQQVDIDEQNVFHLALKNSENKNVVTTVHEILRTHLTIDEIKDMLKQKNVKSNNLIHCASSCSNEITLSAVWCLFEMNFTREELKEILFELNFYDQHCFFTALNLNSQAFVVAFIKIINNFLALEEKRTAFKDCETDGWNIILYAASNKSSGVFEAVWEFVKEVFSEDEIKELLMQKTYDSDENVFHILAKNSNQDNLSFFFETVINVLSAEELKALMSNQEQDPESSSSSNNN